MRWLATIACQEQRDELPIAQGWPTFCIARSKRDGTRAETRFGLSAKRTSPLKLAGVSVQSTAGSRGVRISGQRLYRPCSDVKSKAAGYPLHSNLSPFTSPPVRHHVPSGSERAIPASMDLHVFGNPYNARITVHSCSRLVTGMLISL